MATPRKSNFRDTNPISFYKRQPSRKWMEELRPTARQRKAARLLARGEKVLPALTAAGYGKSARLGWREVARRNGLVIALKEELAASPELRREFRERLEAESWANSSVLNDLLQRLGLVRQSKPIRK
jgi:hypothetical protein